MAAANFESLLRQSIGLDAASIGISAIERAVQQRQVACRLQGRDAYWQHVRTSQAELQALIEAVVVPETWFFRDPDAFAALGRFIRDTRLAGKPDEVARVLSLPCSTGEEPYSMAMVLLDSGVPANRFRVDAIDISERALERARAGEYRKTSFRGQDLLFREIHFEPHRELHRIRDHVKRQVHFRHGNILVPGSLPGSGTYDAVFCRNVLIYFDEDSQRRAIATLGRLLAPGGLLFGGPAEAGVLTNHGFVSARIPKAHAFRRVEEANRDLPRTVTRVPRRPTVAIAPRCTSGSKDTPRGAGRIARPGVEASEAAPPPQSASELENGFRLANQGRFAEAAACCEDHLQRQGPSAPAFYLLGLVHDAAGREHAATGCYRKALYLDPHHHDSLVHLALLLDRQGAAAEAERLRLRARRLAKGTETS